MITNNSEQCQLPDESDLDIEELVEDFCEYKRLYSILSAPDADRLIYLENVLEDFSLLKRYETKSGEWHKTHFHAIRNEEQIRNDPLAVFRDTGRPAPTLGELTQSQAATIETAPDCRAGTKPIPAVQGDGLRFVYLFHDHYTDDAARQAAAKQYEAEPFKFVAWIGCPKDSEPVAGKSMDAFNESSIVAAKTLRQQDELVQRAASGDFSGDDGSAITNFDPAWQPTGDNQSPPPDRLDNILSRLTKRFHNWPRSVGGTLFVPDRRGGIHYLLKHDQLFSWYHEHGTVEWQSSTAKGFVSQKQFYEALIRNATRYRAIETLPHVPPLPGHFYACSSPGSGDGRHLRSLLDHFSPATDIDRDLLMAAMVTPAWGGEPGARPAFFLTSDDGRGVGKSTFTKLVAELWGGDLSFGGNDDSQKMRTRLLSPAALTKRVAILDNVKSMKFSWADWEGMLTASTIGGHQMYMGEATRPNTLTWFVTLNGASLSTDITQRSVIIKLKRPPRSASWETAVFAYVREHRQELVADCIAFLRGEQFQLAKFSRWATWERDILQRLPEPGDAQAVILERQDGANVEADEAELIESYFTERIAELNYDDDDRIFIPSRMAAAWFSEAIGEKLSVTSASRRLGQMSTEGAIKKIQRDPRRNEVRGFIFYGSEWGQEKNIYTQEKYICDDLESRLKWRTDIR